MKAGYRKIWGVFILSVIVYGIIAAVFTSTVHIDVDEELYTALARTFHYQGRFGTGDDILNYSCVLYSMLISLAYYFYEPDRILFLMRLIGVISMCSAVFPIWLLAKKVLKDDREAFIISLFTMILPYMFDTSYLMQEVLSYPLFLWAVYFLYSTHETYSFSQVILSAVFSALCFFTKTYLFFIPVVVNLHDIYIAVKNREIKKFLHRSGLYDGVYLATAAAVYGFIWIANGTAGGSNHYARQFSHLFPVSIQTVVMGIAACILYLSFFIINMGIIPAASVLFNRKKLQGAVRWLGDFCLFSCAFLVIEIVFMVVLTEEGVDTLPHKFLFRYFQVLVPPYIILFMKLKKEWQFLRGKAVRTTAAITLLIAIMYFWYMKGNTRQSIIDGHLFLLIENITKYVFPYADVIIMVFFGILTGGILWSGIKKVQSPVPALVRTAWTGIVLMWVRSCFQLPFYTNVIAEGKVIQEDSIKIAEYLNREGYEFIYYIDSEDKEDYYLQNFYGYVRQQYQVVDVQELEKMSVNEERKTAYLTAAGSVDSLKGFEEIRLDTERIAVYRRTSFDYRG